jgi:lambda repressor-like predicted transcriptional regulator
VLSQKQQQRAELVDTYWQLMRSGETNTSACRVLGMSRRSGTTIRRAHQYQTRVLVPRVVWSGRYLDVRERLQIADLLRLGCSVRRIAAELGRHPSTIKRELDRHRSPEGRYLPRTADHDARQQRARPRAGKLTANITLRRLVAAPGEVLADEAGWAYICTSSRCTAATWRGISACGASYKPERDDEQAQREDICLADRVHR